MRKQLYRNLTIELQRRLPAASKPQVQNLALLTQALVFSEDCHLPNLALQLPIDGQRDHLVRRLMRFLSNCHLTRHTHYLPLVRCLFANWPDREVNLVMDRTDIGQKKVFYCYPLLSNVGRFHLRGEYCLLAAPAQSYRYVYSRKLHPIYPKINGLCSTAILNFGQSMYNGIVVNDNGVGN